VAPAAAPAHPASSPILTRSRPAAQANNVESVKAKVLIRPKQGILDPQGKAIEHALHALGFDGVSQVRVGRLVELEADDPDRLAELCEKLLANPLIEDYEIELDGEATQSRPPEA
jgi:phosphoribosylformylglycinamidine synthase subunit PurS